MSKVLKEKLFYSNRNTLPRYAGK